ncbi:hypothetical protein MUK42_07753 [Musa troglodytarum]|uniref:RRM domain-containing protein n=1 Tax=Musa troglodytarum TaxID=320322 RepID=A0A9E7JFF3_9LILI|nr:hypothetical protein MUK42_07753 [Musa troglodytarum]
MVADAVAKERRNKKKKKKDKWGQPVVALVEDAEQGREENPSQRDAEEQVEEEAAPGGSESYDPNKVVVSGMPYTATEQQIKDLFRDIGTVVQLQLSRFPDSGNFRGLAFVTFQVSLALFFHF